MKNSSIVSAIIGGTFFAVPYLALSAGILPSLAIGVCAYGAGELLLHNKKKEEINEQNRSMYDVLNEAKNKNKQILDMETKVDSPELRKNIKEIGETVNKMIKTLEKKPEKFKKMSNFFDYYLPVTLNILKKYDEIENQRLSSEEGKKFMAQTESMAEKINNAFKNQLSNLYQTDMVDTDAEMKVFESMLKADGYDTSNDFLNKNKNEEE
ncbi:MAG: 5-bromo-4-chloroindolyl phosphate hydrolysis family protein [Clostridia bacterium]|nr:5-bromo-4-chloroindolyl phosphate hydrolysis family protein [Clostridia bacterium]